MKHEDWLKHLSKFKDIDTNIEGRLVEDRKWAKAVFDANPEDAIELFARYKAAYKIYGKIIDWQIDTATLYTEVAQQVGNELADGAFDEGRSFSPRQNALKRHQENHTMKAESFLWLDINMPKLKTIDKAAEMLIKQQPIAFSTARTWIREWKKLQSASTL